MNEYGFHGRLSADFPSQVIVDVTEICNLACVHCPHPHFKQSEHYSGRSLDRALHDKMVEEVRTSGQGLTQFIRYTSNGEPLLHAGIYDMLETAVQRSGVFIALTTNGTSLNERRIERLFQSGLHLIDVSIDAHSPETYASIRVNGHLEVTRNNVLSLIRLRDATRARVHVVVSFIEQPENTSELDAFVRYWKDQGVDRVVVRRLHSAAGRVIGVAEVMRRQSEHEARRPCLYPWERILLNPRGQLAFCPQDWEHGSVLADYRTTTIHELWHSDAYRRLREAHLTGCFEEHSFCGQCPDWQQTRWPAEGASYADMIQSFAIP